MMIGRLSRRDSLPPRNELDQKAMDRNTILNNIQVLLPRMGRGEIAEGVSHQMMTMMTTTSRIVTLTTIDIMEAFQ
jgi:hypothetical protein